MGGGPCDFGVSPRPFALDFGTLDFGTSDLGLTIANYFFGEKSDNQVVTDGFMLLSDIRCL